MTDRYAHQWILSRSVLFLAAMAYTAHAGTIDCRKRMPAADHLPTAFCIDGDLPQAGRDIFTWSLSKAQSRHPWMWHLRGARGAVTRLEIFRASGRNSQKPAYTLLDRAPLTEENPRIVRAGVTDTIVLRPGRYFLEVSCDGACTGKGDPYTLRAVASGTSDLPGYRREWAANDHSPQAQPVPDLFFLDGNLEGREGVFAWTMSKIDADTCGQIFLFLPVGEQGWVKLYDPDGHLLAQRQANQTSYSKAAFQDMGVRKGRYTIRVGPVKKRYTPYRLFTAPLGSRKAEAGKAGSTLACQVLYGE